MTHLWIDDCNASTAQIKAGVAAAEAYLATIGATIEGATDEQFAQAEFEAFKAAFAGWLSWPESASLVRE